ncbi:MAG: hypothetical protein JXR76_26265 [Deltaproteobacteria bacterium]|nr:hypothetical protein [Deltaproteobacteria bacterium]
MEKKKKTEKKSPKDLSPTFGSGGGGPIFESRVQTAFSILMLANGVAPCLRSIPVKEILTQARKEGYATEDLVVTAENSSSRARLLCQVKHNIALTEGNKLFQQVIIEAWQDFNNPGVFTKGTDQIALIAGPLKGTDLEMRTVLEWARTSKDEVQFFNQVDKDKATSKNKRTKVQVFRQLLKDANSGMALTDVQVWEFLKSFHILTFDLDIKRGIVLALLNSIIENYKEDSADEVWSMVLNEVQTININGGTITIDQFDEKIRKIFERKVPEKMPPDFVAATHAGTPKTPTKYKPDTEQALLSLIGGWDENNPNDKKLIERVTREKFDDWIVKIRNLLSSCPGLLKLKDGVWRVNNRVELFHDCGSLIFDDHINNFKNVAIEALTQVDPRFNLEKDERFLAPIKGLRPKFSAHICKGLAGGTALVGVFPDKLKHVTLSLRDGVSVVIVRSVLEGRDWQGWASIKDNLTHLAEAAPQQFLKSVEAELQKHPEHFSDLVSEESSGIGGMSYLSGLLWALESLAWIPDYLPQVTAILGYLDSIDLGSNWGNRPLRSLKDIYLPWKCHTTANGKQKQNAIKPLIKEHPAVAEKLLSGLLPNVTTTTSGTSTPNWIPAPNEEGKWEYKVFRSEYIDQSIFFSNAYVELFASQGLELEKLAAQIDNLTSESFKRACDMIEQADLSSDEQFEIWKKLKSVYQRHYKYRAEDWTMPDENTARLKEVVDKIEPKDETIQLRELFNAKDWDIDSDLDPRQQRELNAKKRDEAAKQLVLKLPLNGLLEFALSTDVPRLVGQHIGSVVDEKQESIPELLSLLDSMDSRAIEFVSAYVWQRYRREGKKWLEALGFEKLNTNRKVAILNYLSFQKDIWDLVEKHLGDDEAKYWKSTPAQVFSDTQNLNFAAEKLLANGRPLAAIRCLHSHLEQGNELDGSLLSAVLIAAVSSHEPQDQMSQFYIENLLEVFQRTQGIPDKIKFRIEWAYLDFMTHRSKLSPNYLNQSLAEQPDFFAMLIRSIYKPREGEAQEPSEQEQNIARQGYKLLDAWSRIPGIDDEGNLAPEKLQSWFENAVKLLKEDDRLEVGLQSLGKVLIHSPADPSGLWIHKDIAEIMNQADMEELRRGYSNALFNLEGYHFVEADGERELKLADEYEQQAKALMDEGFQRLSTTLKELSEQYRRDAKRVKRDFCPDDME